MTQNPPLLWLKENHLLESSTYFKMCRQYSVLHLHSLLYIAVSNTSRVIHTGFWKDPPYENAFLYVNYIYFVYTSKFKYTGTWLNFVIYNFYFLYVYINKRKSEPSYLGWYGDVGGGVRTISQGWKTLSSNHGQS